MRALIRLLAALLCLALTVAGALLVIEVGWAWLRPNSDFVLVAWPAARARFAELAWSDPPVRVTAAIVAAVGLVLLLLAVRAGHKVIRLHDPAPQVTVTTDPRSLARLVGHQVRQQDGVAAATVTAGRKRVRVKATAELTDIGDLDTRLSELAGETVRELPLHTTPRVSVSVRPAKERR